MTTELISINEYRKNISSLWKRAIQKNIKYVILSHSKPIFEVNPVIDKKNEDDWDEYTPKNHKARLKAMKNLEKGDVISLDLNKIKNEEDFIALIKG